MKPQTGRRSSAFRATKRSNDFLRNTTRRSGVHVQTIRLNAETKKCRHRADGEICLLTFPFIGLFRFADLSGAGRAAYPGHASNKAVLRQEWLHKRQSGQSWRQPGRERKPQMNLIQFAARSSVKWRRRGSQESPRQQMSKAPVLLRLPSRPSDPTKIRHRAAPK